MTLITYFLITIVLFITLSVWYKRSLRNNENSIWRTYLDFDIHDHDEALVFISFCSLLWPICIPFGILLISLVIGTRAWRRWMNK